MKSPPTSAAPFVERCGDDAWKSLAECAKACRGCPLWENATQTVFGEGPVPARLMLIGEQPGDQEDRTGRPFVGPAGMMLDHCLEVAGIQRKDVYVTNAVKHFKWVAQGTRRLHAKPSRGEVVACKPWLEGEMERVDPTLLVALGATAAQSLMGGGFKLMSERGRVLPFENGRKIVATLHPSAILRMPNHDAREQAKQTLIADLRVAVRVLWAG